MPRYFFHLRDQDRLHEDCEGVDLPDLHAALEEALQAHRELLAEPAGIDGLEFEITDSSGRTLLKVPLQERPRNRPLTSGRGEKDERRRSPNKERRLH